MSQGQIDHPSYVARQQIQLGVSVTGASKTTPLFSPPASNLRIRACSALVQIAGTGASSVALVAIGTGTTFTSTSSATFTTTSTIGTATLSTSAAGIVVAISTDANLTINKGGYLATITGTDATQQVICQVEGYLDPLTSWTGN